MKPIFLTKIMRRESVANSDAREAAIANAFSETEPMEENSDGWFKVSPYGVFRGKTPGRPQHFTEDAAKRMESEFNSLRGKLGRMFRGIPIYIGHPDVDPTIWTDDRRLGKATEMQARPDGLWAYAEWNSLGRENQTEGFWVYPSPRWDAPPGQSRFEPDRLISIGLTNTPRIETSEPLANSQLDTNTETPTLMDPKLIREKLGLAPETTDEEVFAKIESLTNAATEAETRATEAENAKATAEQTAATEKQEKDQIACSLQTAEANVISFREVADNAVLDLAVRDGKITKSERASWKTKLAGDQREAAANSLATLKPKLNTQSLAGGQDREAREQSDNQREAVANAVAELEKTGLSYVDAWGKVKKDPKFSTYFNRSEG
jgi:Mu-like prophage I protein